MFTKIYNSWRELGKRELENRSAPLHHAMNETWESLIRTEMEPEVHGSGQPFVKQRWTDLAYYLAQDVYMFGDEVPPALACVRLAMIGFVRATCSRSGSFTKDQADKQGLTRYHTINVLSVRDFTWDPFGMEIEETSESAALRGEVVIQRIKRYYMELYRYCMSVTPDQLLEEARRVSTLIAAYLFARGLFLVQYAGMAPRAVQKSLARRRIEGHRMGMPDGACITAEEAIRR